MTQVLLTNVKHERPALIAPIVVLAFAYAVLLCVCGVLSILGQMSMRVGAQLLGSGLEVMGPTPYLIYSVALGVGGWGTMRARNWARRLLILICSIGVVLLVPHISSAVVDERWAAMALDGLQILVRVAIASYLLREAEWFR